MLVLAHIVNCRSSRQQCPDRHALGIAVKELFAAHCDVQSPEGVDLDLVSWGKVEATDMG